MSEHINIMVVEDNIETAKALKETYTEIFKGVNEIYKANIEIIYNGTDAIKKIENAKNNEFDFISLDLNLSKEAYYNKKGEPSPGIDGRTVLRKAAERGVAKGMVIVSGILDDQNTEWIKDDGNDIKTIRRTIHHHLTDLYPEKSAIFYKSTNIDKTISEILERKNDIIEVSGVNDAPEYGFVINSALCTITFWNKNNNESEKMYLKVSKKSGLRLIGKQLVPKEKVFYSTKNKEDDQHPVSEIDNEKKYDLDESNAGRKKKTKPLDIDKKYTLKEVLKEIVDENLSSEINNLIVFNDSIKVSRIRKKMIEINNSIIYTHANEIIHEANKFNNKLEIQSSGEKNQKVENVISNLKNEITSKDVQSIIEKIVELDTVITGIQPNFAQIHNNYNLLIKNSTIITLLNENKIIINDCKYYIEILKELRSCLHGDTKGHFNKGSYYSIEIFIKNKIGENLLIFKNVTEEIHKYKALLLPIWNIQINIEINKVKIFFANLGPEAGTSLEPEDTKHIIDYYKNLKEYSIFLTNLGETDTNGLEVDKIKGDIEDKLSNLEEMPVLEDVIEDFNKKNTEVKKGTSKGKAEKSKQLDNQQKALRKALEQIIASKDVRHQGIVDHFKSAYGWDENRFARFHEYIRSDDPNYKEWHVEM